jgi:hypothetical protein
VSEQPATSPEPAPEPEPESDDEVADPAQTIEDLAADLEQVQGLVRTVAWGVSRETDELKAALIELTARVEALEPPAPEPAAAEEDEPRAWVDYATAKDWEDLAEWVDWLADTYDVVPSRTVLRCWPAHRGVVEELAALRSAWRAAATAGQGKAPSDALIVWHDRWLHPCLSRLREGFQQKNCQDAHSAPRPRQLTDPDLLAAALPEGPTS